MSSLIVNNPSFNTIETTKGNEFNPLYVDNKILPDELDLTPNAIREMNDEEWKIWALQCQKHFIDQYENYRIPFIGNQKSLEQIISDFKKLDELDVNDSNNKVCVKNSSYESVLMGNNRFSSGILNWFPEIIEVKRTVNNRVENSLWDAVQDESYFLKKFEVITRRDIHLREQVETISEGLINELRLKLGHPATNFRAEVAKWIWFNHLQEFADDRKDELVVYDPSGGWGGRLVGFLAMASDPIFKDRKLVYLVTDPNPIVGKRYEMLMGFWKQHINKNLNVKLVHLEIGSQDIHTTVEFEKYRNKVSVVFTSPPYFYRERYVENNEQSFAKFETYDYWRDYFLEPTLDNGNTLLREGGTILWNIADVDGYTLEMDSCNILEMLELQQMNTLKMTMGSKEVEKHLGVEIHNGNYKKYENVFVFKKGVNELEFTPLNNINYNDKAAKAS